MFCEKCGTEINDNDKFCEKCGYAVDNNLRQTQSVMQPEKRKINFFHFFVGASIFVFVVAFVFFAMYFVKQSQSRESEKTKEQQEYVQNNEKKESEEDSQAIQEQQLFNANYSIYCGNYELEKVREEGSWKSYNMAGEVAGAILDFRNYYEFGNQTQTYNAPSISLTMDSIDLSDFDYGVHSISEFYYEEINGMDFFIDSVHEFAIFSDGTYLYIAFLNSQDAWQGYYAFQ